MWTEYWLTAKSKLAEEKNVVRLTDGLNMTIAVDRDIEPKTKRMLFLSCENC